MIGLIVFTLWSLSATRVAGETPYPEIGSQLASLLTIPPLVQEKGGQSIVVVQFDLTRTYRIRQVDVFSGNATLDADIIRQLTGRKLSLEQRPAIRRHTVRLRFQAD